MIMFYITHFKGRIYSQNNYIIMYRFIKLVTNKQNTQDKK